jgi:hypothetical protein
MPEWADGELAALVRRVLPPRRPEWRVSGEAVGEIVRERVSAAGLDPLGYSGHSLRAGLVTSTSQIGVPTWKIRAVIAKPPGAFVCKYLLATKIMHRLIVEGNFEEVRRQNRMECELIPAETLLLATDSDGGSFVGV